MNFPIGDRRTFATRKRKERGWDRDARKVTDRENDTNVRYIRLPHYNFLLGNLSTGFQIAFLTMFLKTQLRSKIHRAMRFNSKSPQPRSLSTTSVRRNRDEIQALQQRVDKSLNIGWFHQGLILLALAALSWDTMKVVCEIEIRYCM